MTSKVNDPFNLSRFVIAQEKIYSQALSEILNGKKETHWMWFVFPQYYGLGSSSYSIIYSIKSKDEAIAYLQHQLLGSRLVECCKTLLCLEGKSAFDIFSTPDDLKLRSSLTLFGYFDSPFRDIFSLTLKKYFIGIQDEITLKLLNI